MTPSVTKTSTTTTATTSTLLVTEDVELSVEQGYDDEQIRLMQEVCIVIDENDQPIRSGTKKECTSPLCYSQLIQSGPLNDKHSKGTVRSCIFAILVQSTDEEVITSTTHE